MNHEIFIIKLKHPLKREDFKNFWEIGYEKYGFMVNWIDVSTYYIDCGGVTNLLPKDIVTWFPKDKVARVIKFGKITEAVIKF